jgi:hypothetical protein
MDMQQGHHMQHGHAGLTWVFSIEVGMQHGHTAWTCSKDMQLGQVTDTHLEHAARICSMDKQYRHEHAAWTHATDM